MSQELLREAKRAAGWTALARWFEAAASFVSLLVLVRILGPETYGVYGMTLVAIAIPSGIVGGPLAECLIQRETIHRGHEAATFYAETLVSLLIAAVLIALTPALAAGFSEPTLLAALPAMAFAPLLSSLGATPCALLQRGMRFKAIAAVDTFGTVSAMIVGVTLAIAGFGIWSLVALELARRLVRSIGFWAVARRPLAFRASRRDFADLAHFNSYTIVNKVLAQADTAIPGAVIGAVLGAPALGFYNLASRLYTQASQVLLAPLNAVSLPLASQARSEPGSLKLIFSEGLRVSTAVAYPFFIGSAVVAPIFVPLLFGPEWVDMVVTVQLMMLLGIRAATATFNGAIIRGSGKPATQAAITGLGLGLLLVGAPAAASFGLNAIVAVLLARGLVTWLVSAAILRPIMQMSVWRQVTLGWPSLVASLIMAAAVAAVVSVMDAARQPVLTLGVAAATGIVVYAIALAVSAPRLVERLVQFAKRRAPVLA